MFIDSLGKKSTFLHQNAVFDQIKKNLNTLDGKSRFADMKLEILPDVPYQGKGTNKCGSFVGYFMQEIIQRMKNDPNATCDKIVEHISGLKGVDAQNTVKEFRQSIWDKISRG